MLTFPFRRHTALAAATLLTAVAAPAAAIAAPDWVAPRTIPDDAATAGQVSLAVDAQGRSTYGQATVRNLSPIVTHVGLLSNLPGEPISEQFAMDSTPGGSLPAGAIVAAGPDGSAAACITELTGPTPATDPLRNSVTYRAAGSSTWEPPTVLVTSSRVAPPSAASRSSARTAPQPSRPGARRLTPSRAARRCF